MATLLKKNVTRESTKLIEERSVLVTLNVDQTVNLRLKGLRGKGIQIGITDLYNLINKSVQPPVSSVDSKKTMINLCDLRSLSAISTLDYETKVKFESIITNLLGNIT